MRDFATLFRGRDDAYGQYGSIAGVKATARGKKATGNNPTVRGPVTADLFEAHLSGKQRLGIVPVMKDNHVFWSCIDVDFYQEVGLHETIAARIKEYGLPLNMTRSKSGGAHLWCFFEKPVPAAKAMVMMESFRKRLQLPDEHIDIFPKQAKVNDVGSWVNLPYFNGTCTWTGEDGKGDHPLSEFVEHSNGNLARGEYTKEPPKETKKKSDLPPCIDKMIENGVEEGGRNDSLTQYAVLAKKKWPEDWQDKVREFNAEKLSPSLTQDEVKRIIGSVGKGEYQYLCTQMKALGICDKPTCMTRAFGVGQQADFEIEHIEKIDGETPLYRVRMEGKVFQCKPEEFAQYHKFRLIAFAVLDRYLPPLKQPVWEELSTNYLATMTKSNAASDTQMSERVLRTFMMWCSAGCTTDAIDIALEAGVPFYDGKAIIFRGNDFMSVIDRSLKISRDMTWVYMRDHGTLQSAVTINGKKTPVWSYPVEPPLWFDPNRGQQT